MKSNRKPEDPQSNRKGGTPFWDKMKPKGKSAAAQKPSDATPRKKARPSPPRAQQQAKGRSSGSSEERGWDQVAQWYDRLVGNEGSDYHKNIIIPACLEQLGEIKGLRVLDVCCGQGFAGKIMTKAGAAMVHGIDASPQLIASARQRAESVKNLSYEVADACAAGDWSDGSYDIALNIMAVHDVPNLPGLCQNLARSLKRGGRALMVFMHPCFRVPKQSHWGWDQQQMIQYRRMDRYGSALSIPIVTHPGRASGETTTFYHRPLPEYFQAMKQAGLVVTDCRELFSHRRSQAGGPRSNAEHLAAEEFPMFMLLEIQKIAVH